MPLSTNATVRVEREPGLFGSFESLDIHEPINGHHSFSLALPGSPCVGFITHGQTQSGSPQSFEEADSDMHSQLNPMADPSKSKYRAFKPDLNIKVIE